MKEVQTNTFEILALIAVSYMILLCLSFLIYQMDTELLLSWMYAYWASFFPQTILSALGIQKNESTFVFAFRKYMQSVTRKTEKYINNYNEIYWGYM